MAVSTTSDHKPTQYERVLRALMMHDEICGHRTFYGEMRIPRFGAHINRARKAGFVILKRPCDLPDHNHEGTGWLYRLEYAPRPPAGKPCVACGGILAHVSTCPTRTEDGQLPFASDGAS